MLGESQDLQFVSRVPEKHHVVTVYAYAAATFPLMNKIIHDIMKDEDESENEEPRIKDVLSNLSQAVFKERASDLLHIMAAFKDIIFWTPHAVS